MFQLVQMKIKLNKILVEKIPISSTSNKVFQCWQKISEFKKMKKKREKNRKTEKTEKITVGKKKEKGKTYSNIYKFKHMKSYLIPNEYDGKKRSMFHAFRLMLMIEVGCLCHAQTPNWNICNFNQILLNVSWTVWYNIINWTRFGVMLINVSVWWCEKPLLSQYYLYAHNMIFCVEYIKAH